jgi:hypothetical protein
MTRLVPHKKNPSSAPKRGAQNFEDFERMVIELKAIMFKYLYVWMAVYNTSCFSNFLEFLDFCSLF